MNVTVGPATKAGYSVTLTAFALAIVAYLTGDHSEQTIGVIVSGAVGLLTLTVTQLGRYAQAHAQAKTLAVAPVSAAELDLDDPELDDPAYQPDGGSEPRSEHVGLSDEPRRLPT